MPVLFSGSRCTYQVLVGRARGHHGTRRPAGRPAPPGPGPGPGALTLVPRRPGRRATVRSRPLGPCSRARLLWGTATSRAKAGSSPSWVRAARPPSHRAPNTHGRAMPTLAAGTRARQRPSGPRCCGVRRREALSNVNPGECRVPGREVRIEPPPLNGAGEQAQGRAEPGAQGWQGRPGPRPALPPCGQPARTRGPRLGARGRGRPQSTGPQKTTLGGRRVASSPQSAQLDTEEKQTN